MPHKFSWKSDRECTGTARVTWLGYPRGVLVVKVRVMDDPNSNPAFEARHLTSASGWYVRVAWPNGKCDHIPGFVSQKEAQRWIEGKAPAWLSGQSKVPRASFGRLAAA
jgi:hypothetical protein